MLFGRGLYYPTMTIGQDTKELGQGENAYLNKFGELADEHFNRWWEKQTDESKDLFRTNFDAHTQISAKEKKR